MTLGERIRTCRQKAGMSQEKVAELMGVSRQAVTKWEGDRSAPNTENLFKLAEIFGTTVDLLLVSEDDGRQPPAEQICARCKLEAAGEAARKKQALKRNMSIALLVAVGYIGLYLAGRVIWCDFSQSSLTGWLFTVRPSGEHSYLYGWLLSRDLFWYAMAISVLPALLGKHGFSWITLLGFAVGLVTGILFGPYPEGAAIGHSDYGWAIWGAAYLASVVAGVIIERYRRRADNCPAE